MTNGDAIRSEILNLNNEQIAKLFVEIADRSLIVLSEKIGADLSFGESKKEISEELKRWFDDQQTQD